mgnify:CR=1 FL=1
MSTPFIATADLARLRTAAEAWVGTPYAADGCVKGAGCSCQLLPSAVLHELGHTHPPAPARGTLRKVELLPAMRAWLEAHPEHFAPVALDAIAPGDVLLINAGTGHLALALERGDMLHVWQHTGAHISARANIVTRIVGAWRPVVPAL